jgi:mono/diheme cytochrome c family protein
MYAHGIARLLVALTALTVVAIGARADSPPSDQAAGAPAAPMDVAALYKKHCQVCHGAKGDSKLPGMSFVDGQWKHGTSVKEMSALIKDGIPGTAMLPFKSKLKDPEVEALAKFVRAFDPALK